MTRRTALLSFAAAPALVAYSEHHATEKKVFAAVNVERAKRGLPTLGWDDAVAEVARLHSYRMADNEFFAHQDAATGNVRTRLEKAGIGWQRCAENLYRERGYPRVVESALSGWMDSPAHQENLLGREYNRSGIGIAVSRNETYYVTQVFIKGE